MSEIPEEIEGFLNAIPRVPTLRDDCFYNSQGRHWIPENKLSKLKKQEKDELKNVRFILQFAPTAFSTCRSCGQKIQKKEIRLGYAISVKRYSYRFTSRTFVFYSLSHNVVVGYLLL